MPNDVLMIIIAFINDVFNNSNKITIKNRRQYGAQRQKNL